MLKQVQHDGFYVQHDGFYVQHDSFYVQHDKKKDRFPDPLYCHHQLDCFIYLAFVVKLYE